MDATEQTMLDAIREVAEAYVIQVSPQSREDVGRLLEMAMRRTVTKLNGRQDGVDSLLEELIMIKVKALVETRVAEVLRAEIEARAKAMVEKLANDSIDSLTERLATDDTSIRTKIEQAMTIAVGADKLKIGAELVKKHRLLAMNGVIRLAKEVKDDKLFADSVRSIVRGHNAFIS